MRQLRAAVHSLSRHNGIEQLLLSPVYRSPPMGPQDQPDYLNAVARFDTELAAESLLDSLQAIERSAGRVRGSRWGPRTLDLDLLLYGNQCSRSTRLTIPHPGLMERAFVLVPLSDLAGPDLAFPDGRRLAQALARCPESRLQRIAEPDELLAPYPESHDSEQ